MFSQEVSLLRPVVGELEPLHAVGAGHENVDEGIHDDRDLNCIDRLQFYSSRFQTDPSKTATDRPSLAPPAEMFEQCPPRAATRLANLSESPGHPSIRAGRSEERRVGKEWCT